MVMPFHDHYDDSTFDYDIDYIIDDYREHELNDEFNLAAGTADHINYHGDIVFDASSCSFYIADDSPTDE